MKIEELVKLIRAGKFQGISCDSRVVKKGFVFLAIKGLKKDGSRFIKEAQAKGAKVIVCDLKAKVSGIKDIPVVKVRDTRLASTQLAAEFYRNPSDNLKVVGITGTCGKTTVTYILEAILKEAGFKPAVIGTVNYRFGDKVFPAGNTTPGPLELGFLMSNMLKERIKYLAMEVSSHALDQGRVSKINFHSAIFTNLTQDHLDYHRTLSGYFRAKSKLFAGLFKDAFAVLNYDDKYFTKFKKITRAKIITYGLSPGAEVRAEDIEYNLKATKFLLVLPNGELKVKTSLIGRHNVYNILAACAWAYEEGVALHSIKSGIDNFRFVPGRLEQVNCKKGFSIFVDYAHTEDALKNALVSLKSLGKKRIITVFGCGGERDALKRPKMGKAATEISDFVIITNDNPRGEKPEAIIKDIKKGICKNNYTIILDRKKAIMRALAMANKGDIVLIAGKGHENFQIMEDAIINFDDRKEIGLCLKLMN